MTPNNWVSHPLVTRLVAPIIRTSVGDPNTLLNVQLKKEETDEVAVDGLAPCGFVPAGRAYRKVTTDVSDFEAMPYAYADDIITIRFTEF